MAAPAQDPQVTYEQLSQLENDFEDVEIQISKPPSHTR